MYSEKRTLSIRLTEPVVPLRSAPERDAEMLPPATVRGLLTLTLPKPTKVSSIELELRAKATTHYVRGDGPARIDVTEQYKVYSASTILFRADRSTSTSMPRVPFRDNHARLDAQHGPSPSLRRWLSSYDLATDAPRREVDPVIPYSSRTDHRSMLGADSCPFAADSSRSVLVTEPQGKHFVPPVGTRTNAEHTLASSIPPQSTPTTDTPRDSPTPSVHSTHDRPLSRTSSIEDVSPDDGANFQTTAPNPDDLAYYGLSCITTHASEQDRRGRPYSRLSFGNIFDVVTGRLRSRSPRAGSLPWSDEHGRSSTKRGGSAQVSARRMGAAETSIVDHGANDQAGEDWVVFPEGTYTYPIFFTIPHNTPPTMKANHGSLIWKVKGEVKRPSAFTPKMTTQKEVFVVCLPKEDGEDAEGLDLQRQWDGQLQYRVRIPGRGFPVGGTMPFQLTIMPTVKIKVHSISVYLDERTSYYTQAETEARSDAIRRTTLLVIKHNNLDERNSEPILPLASAEPGAFRHSPLYRLLGPGQDEREAASSLVGSGPWTIHHQLKIPDSCSNIHPSNQTKGSNVMVNHTLKITIRVEKAEEGSVTSRKKLYDIVIHAPIQILSCRCTSEWAHLPRYDDALRSNGDSPENTSTCPCHARKQAKTRTYSHATNLLPAPLQRVASLPTTNSSSSGGSCPSDSLASRTRLHELLMRGLVSERGEVPPPYERVGG